MPNKSVTIFLAGHGAVSSKGTIVEDQYLKDHRIIFPAKIQGQLCFVAHNILLQELIDKESLPYNVLKKFESYYGISTVSISNGKQVKLSFLYDDNSCLVDLANPKDRLELYNLLKIVKSISAVFKAIEEINEKSPQLLAGTGEIEVNRKELDKLQDDTSIFKDVRLDACLVSYDRASQIEHTIEKLLKENANIENASLLLEHKLGSWEQSMERYPWQKEMPYSPLINGSYEKFTVVNYASKTLTNLNFYINTQRLKSDIATSKPSPSSDEFTILPLKEDGTIYITNTSESGITLSQILDYLHKSHVYVARSDDNKVIDILGAFIVEPLKEPKVWDLNAYRDEMTWYDFTIPTDANIVWGACRDLGDF